MSYVSTFNALNTTNTTSGQKLVLSVIASFERNGKAWPSVATIAKRCSMGARTVQRHIAALVSLGYLQRIYRQGKAAITRVFIGETPAKLAPVTPAKLAPNESVIFESVNDSGTPPATPEPQHQQAALPAAAMPPSLFSDIEQPANTTTEPAETPYSASNEHEGTNPSTDTAIPAVEAEIDPLATVPPVLLADLGEVRRAKKRPAKPTKTEADLWWAEAQRAGWTMQQVILTMVLRGWSRFDASWVQHAPPQTRQIGQEVVFKPEPLPVASPAVVANARAKLAELRAQILADGARRREQIARLRQ